MSKSITYQKDHSRFLPEALKLIRMMAGLLARLIFICLPMLTLPSAQWHLRQLAEDR